MSRIEDMVDQILMEDVAILVDGNNVIGRDGFWRTDICDEPKITDVKIDLDNDIQVKNGILVTKGIAYSEKNGKVITCRLPPGTVDWIDIHSFKYCQSYLATIILDEEGCLFTSNKKEYLKISDKLLTKLNDENKWIRFLRLYNNTIGLVNQKGEVYSVNQDLRVSLLDIPEEIFCSAKGLKNAKTSEF